jgi:hypothetical protein
MAGKRKIKRKQKQQVIVVQQPKKTKPKRKANGPGPMETAGNILGKLLGGALGAPGIGSSLGGLAGKGIGWITGTGAYKTNFDSVKTSIPSFSGDETTVITHREYLTDIYSAPNLVNNVTPFNIQTYALQPGNTGTFSWLAQVAANYEEYDILGMVFCFKSTSGESVAAANTTLGTVILATEYDSTKPPFTSKLQMENYHFAMSGKPSESMYHAVECKNSQSTQKHLYIRTSAPATNNDLRWSDYGNFSIATVGQQQSNVNLGELWVTYKVKLYKPRLPITVGEGGSIGYGHSSNNTVSNTYPLGNVVGYSNATLNGFSANHTTVTWIADPTQVYQVSFIWSGQATPYGWTVPSLTRTNCTSYNCLANKTTDSIACATGTGDTSTTSMLSEFVQVTGNSPQQTVSINVSSPAFGAYPAYVDIVVVQMDSTFV